MPKITAPLNYLIKYAREFYNNPPDWFIWGISIAVAIAGLLAANEQNQILK